MKVMLLIVTVVMVITMFFRKPRPKPSSRWHGIRPSKMAAFSC